MAVSSEEKLAIEVLALSERMKPATFVREIFFRGLHDYLKDGEPHAPDRDDEIYAEIVERISNSPELRKIQRLVEGKRQLVGVLSMSPEATNPNSKGGKKK